MEEFKYKKLLGKMMS